MLQTMRAIRRRCSTSAAAIAHEPQLDALCAPVPPVRLDNFLSNSGFCPRRDVRKFCRDSVVESRPSDGGAAVRHVLGSDRVQPGLIHIDGDPIPLAGVQLHIVMHKPLGVVCSHDEPGQRLVYSLMPSVFQLRKPALHSVGRLDKDTSGLLLFTQSGTLTARLTSPRRACEKVYIVQLAQPLRGDEAAAFASGGLALIDGSVCLPALLQPHPKERHVCRVTLQEGRYHQLRRMFAAVGHVVVALHRAAFGGLTLERLGLQQGQWRLLTRDELSVLLQHSTAEVKQLRVKQPQRVRIRSDAPPRVSNDDDGVASSGGSGSDGDSDDEPSLHDDDEALQRHRSWQRTSSRAASAAQHDVV